MRSEERQRWLVAGGVSLIAHAAAVAYYARHEFLSSGAPHPEQMAVSISVSFSSPVPETVPEPTPEPEAEPEQLVEQALEPQPEPEPEVEPEPEQLVELEQQPQPKPKPRPVKVAKSTPKKKPQTPPRRVQAAPPAAASAASSKQASVAQPAMLKTPFLQQRALYLARLLAHIDRHKFYSRKARRRGIEGDIQISFVLLRDGGIQGLEVTGSNRLLRKAAEKTLRRALPMPPMPDDMGLTENISFSMQFRLK